MRSRLDRLARAYPVAVPAIGPPFSAGAADALQMAPSEHGKALSLLASAGAKPPPFDSPEWPFILRPFLLWIAVVSVLLLCWLL